MSSFSATLRALVLLAPLALAGCLTASSATLAKLARLNPLEADPSQIRIALKLPPGLGVRDGDVTVKLEFTDDTGRMPLAHAYKAEVTNDVAPPELAGGLRKGAGGAIVPPSPADAARMRGAQAYVREYRSGGGKGKGSLSVGATGCRAGALASGPLPVSAYIRTTPNDTFTPLYRNLDLRKALKQAGVDAEAMPLCDPAS